MPGSFSSLAMDNWNMRDLDTGSTGLLLQSRGFYYICGLFGCVISGHIAVGVAFNGRVACSIFKFSIANVAFLGLLP